jgi:hypothetical protein
MEHLFIGALLAISVTLVDRGSEQCARILRVLAGIVRK